MGLMVALIWLRKSDVFDLALDLKEVDPRALIFLDIAVRDLAEGWGSVHLVGDRVDGLTVRDGGEPVALQ